MALAYFNLMLGKDQSGLKVLRSNPWRQHGASVELRGVDAEGAK